MRFRLRVGRVIIITISSESTRLYSLAPPPPPPPPPGLLYIRKKDQKVITIATRGRVPSN